MRVTSGQQRTGVDEIAQLALIRNVAEDLKLPLARIQAYTSDTKNMRMSRELIHHTINSAIDFIDTYILCIQVQSGQQQLHVEPVALQPLFDEASHNLTPLAKKHNIQIRSLVTSSTKTVLSDRTVLQKLFTVLGYSFLQTTPPDKSRVLQYHARLQKDFVRAGVIGENIEIKHQDLEQVKSNYGRASMLSSNLPFGISAGLAIADLLARAMDNTLQPIRRKTQTGLGVTLLPSSQLRLL